MAQSPAPGTDSVPPIVPVGPGGQHAGPPPPGSEQYNFQQQQFGGPPPPLTAKQAQAHAKAAKAQAKALRPIYKKKRFYVLLAIILIVIIAIANSISGDDGATTGVPAGEAPAAKNEAPLKKEAPANPGLNTAVQSGDLSMTVTKIKCGAKSLGSSDFGVKADGQFCLMSLTAENTGDEAVTLSGDSQKLLDAKGRQFSADDEAWLYIGDQGSNVIFEEINPGNTSKGIVVFDVPKNVTPIQAVVSGDFFGGDEVTIDLK